MSKVVAARISYSKNLKMKSKFGFSNEIYQGLKHILLVSFPKFTVSKMRQLLLFGHLGLLILGKNKLRRLCKGNFVKAPKGWIKMVQIYVIFGSFTLIYLFFTRECCIIINLELHKYVLKNICVAECIIKHNSTNSRYRLVAGQRKRL